MIINPLIAARDFLLGRPEPEERRGTIRRYDDLKSKSWEQQAKEMEKFLAETNQHLVDAIAGRDAYKALSETILHELSGQAQEVVLSNPAAVRERRLFVDKLTKKYKNELLETLNP